MVPAIPASSTQRTKLAATTGPLWRLRNLFSRYPADGGRASTGSSARYRWTSRARPLAVSYRRSRRFSRHFITTQSNSPRNGAISFFGSICRSTASDGNDSSVESRVLGFDGSSSWMMRIISVIAAFFNRLASTGRRPVSNS